MYKSMGCVWVGPGGVKSVESGNKRPRSYNGSATYRRLNQPGSHNGLIKSWMAAQLDANSQLEH